MGPGTLIESCGGVSVKPTNKGRVHAIDAATPASSRNGVNHTGDFLLHVAMGSGQHKA